MAQRPRTTAGATQSVRRRAAPKSQAAVGAVRAAQADPATWTREAVLAAQAAQMSEAQLDECLVACLNAYGWDLIYHTHDSRRSQPGFPDWVALRKRDHRIAFIEDKSQKGRVRPEQDVWLQALWDSGRVEVYLFRPEDWLSGRIEEVLR